MIKQLKKQI